MLKSLLIANRGEIACRIIRTARRLGVRTVAVYSQADAGALHVREADEAIAIGPASARESYLDGARLIEAAKQSGAEAVHPGYGFLSENADFAQAVLDAGLVWVGPPPSAIRAMGLKDAAKRLMQAAGVPVTPGYQGEDQSPECLRREADAIGYPVLIKAVAGGGGKGMRRVDAGGGFEAALAACRREARAAFGDDRVLIETCIARPRHIEVQIFGDGHGNIVHLFERDCSVQRRHQKIIEEAPAPGMDEATRNAICAAAVQAARAVGYVGAGTVEFIADTSAGLRADRVWFMEMNTRLQVEHPVTEAITGQDLVEWQLRVASGEPLPMRQENLRIEGWAIEARLYAEDPAREFLPSTGRLDLFHLPSAGLRLETGVGEGDAISPFYDPMIAKLIAKGPTRREAALRLAAGVAEIAVWPVKTNAALLAKALSHPDFLAGAVDTGFIESRAASLMPAGQPSSAVLDMAARALAAAFSPTPLAGFRLNREAERTVRLRIDGHAYQVETEPSPLVGEGVPKGRMRGTLDSSGTRQAIKPAEPTPLIPLPGPSPIRGEGSRFVQVYPYGEGFIVSAGGESFQAGPDRTEGSAGAQTSDGTLLAPMPGRLIAVSVAAGDTVTRGEALLVLEAMKMEYTLRAPFDGTVEELAVSAGAQVTEGARLLRIGKAAS